jgi:hypothetical protein
MADTQQELLDRTTMQRTENANSTNKNKKITGDGAQCTYARGATKKREEPYAFRLAGGILLPT